MHISTQCNITNFEAVKFYSQFADVVVLARELDLDQVMTIHRQIVAQDLRGPKGELMQIEMFAHGALCMAVSGKCYLSLHEMNASANRGACYQICRRSYTVKDTDSEVELEVDGKYIMSPKDLCTIGFINKLIDAGVRVFKIEGRARSAEYVKTVCECYNEAIDAYGRTVVIPPKRSNIGKNGFQPCLTGDSGMDIIWGNVWVSGVRYTVRKPRKKRCVSGK